jgi:membrane protease YdiL (CAAX protease family)
VKDHEPPEGSEGGGAALLAIAAVVYGLLAGLGWFWLRQRDRLDALGAMVVGRHAMLVEVSAGLLAGLALAGASALAGRRIGVIAGLEREQAKWLGRLRPETALALSLVSGPAEELFFRGATQDALGWIWAAVLFGAAHVGPGAFWIWPILAAAVGLGFGAMVAAGFGLISVGIAHSVTNYLTLRRITRT